jgi:hypothetical protein
MTVPVHVTNADAYELTRKSLEQMWNMYANTMLPNISLSVRYQIYEVKNMEGQEKQNSFSKSPESKGAFTSTQQQTHNNLKVKMMIIKYT